MKKRRILIQGIFLAVLILLVFLVISWKMSQNEDLFKQLQEGETLAESENAVRVVDTNRDGETETSRAEDKLSVEVTAQKGRKDDVQSFREQQESQLISEEPDSKQQEADMETLGLNYAKSFYYEELTKEIKERINGKSYGENCTIPYEDLRYVSVLYWGFDNQTHTGELIVNRAIAEDIVAIFTELYEVKYPIERMVLVDEYDADDNTSMAANNSSAFNFRVIEGTNRISKHSYGLAIDINPLYNPYIHEVEGERVVTPVEGAEYEDRSLNCPYYILEGDQCYEAFIRRGFTWGGDWKNQKDYQHFQKTLPEE